MGNIHVVLEFSQPTPHLLPPVPTSIEPPSMQAQRHSFFIPNSRMSYTQKALNGYFLNFAEQNLTSGSKS